MGTKLYEVDIKVTVAAKTPKDAVKKIRKTFGSPIKHQLITPGYVVEDICVDSAPVEKGW